MYEYCVRYTDILTVFVTCCCYHCVCREGYVLELVCLSVSVCTHRVSKNKNCKPVVLVIKYPNVNRFKHAMQELMLNSFAVVVPNFIKNIDN